MGDTLGSYVQDGIFERNCSVRLIRDGIVVFDGPLASLKRFKDDVKEVRAGYECGFVFENYNDVISFVNKDERFIMIEKLFNKDTAFKNSLANFEQNKRTK